MKNSFTYLSVIIIFLAISGCTAIKKPIQNKIAQHYALPPISSEKLENRIDDIKNLLKSNKLSGDKKETAILLLTAYEKIRDMNRGNSTREENLTSIQILFDTLGIMDHKFLFYDTSSIQDTEKRIINEYNLLKKQILEEYLADNINEVITRSKELESRYGKAGVTPDIGVILVDSLTKASRSKDALLTAKSIIDEIESKPDLVYLLTDIISIEIKNGNTKEATYFYEKLSDYINEKNNTYKEAENLISKSRQISSLIDTSIEKKVSDLNPEKKIKAEETLNNVQKLLVQNNFSEARLILLRWRLSAEEGPEIDMIEQALKNIDTAEEKYSNSDNKDYAILENAKKQIENEKYEEALKILEPLVSDGSNFEAERLQNLAIDKFINNERLKAAKLYMTANEENNKQKKKEMLLKSREILDRLINDYPQTPLLDKLKSYIQKIDRELEQLAQEEMR